MAAYKHDKLLKDIQDTLSEEYNIRHLTIQIDKDTTKLNCEKC